MKSDNDKLSQIISEYDATILYEPLKGEINPTNQTFPIKIHASCLTLPNTSHDNPFNWAKKCTAIFKNAKTYILIPGTKFDMYGTRHGRGAGWYDRFLSNTPTTWLRIGIADKTNFSSVKLVRQPWDEPVDWVVVRDGTKWTFYNTDASES